MDRTSKIFSLDFIWTILPAALMAIVLALLPLRSWDYWWHIAMGRLFNSSGVVPKANYFLYTLDATTPYFVQPWLGQWMLFRLHELGGLELVLLLRDLLAASAFGAIGWVAARRSHSKPLGAMAALIGMFFCFRCIDERPELLMWPIFVVLLILAYDIRSRRRALGWLTLFPLVAAFWVNVHGSFLMPAILAGAFGAAAVTDIFLKRGQAGINTSAAAWTFTAAACLAALLLNPAGLKIFTFLKNMTSNEIMRSYITEWMPTTLRFPPILGPIFYLVSAATCFLFWRHWRELDLADLFLFVGFFAMTVKFCRAFLWFGLIWPLAISPYLRELNFLFDPKENTESSWKWLNLVLVTTLIAAAIALQPISAWQARLVSAWQYIPTRSQNPLKGRVMAETPVEPVEILRGRGNIHHLFHDVIYAGFIIYRLQDAKPRQMVFMDQRIDFPGPDLWKLYDDISSTNAWRSAFQKYDIDAVIANQSSQAPLIRRLKQERDWTLLYEDKFNALFVHQDGLKAGP
jgi:hypothetical protein